MEVIIQEIEAQLSVSRDTFEETYIRVAAFKNCVDLVRDAIEHAQTLEDAQVVLSTLESVDLAARIVGRCESMSISKVHVALLRRAIVCENIAFAEFVVRYRFFDGDAFIALRSVCAELADTNNFARVQRALLVGLGEAEEDCDDLGPKAAFFTGK